VSASAIFAAIALVSAGQDNGGMSKVRDAMDAWKICGAEYVNRMALSTKEPAATIVDAAYGECRHLIRPIQQAMFDLGANVATTDETIEFLRTNFRETLLAGVLRLRSSSG
jgi:uncharacterized protein YqgV (UPF0045/DUF77 family)